MAPDGTGGRLARVSPPLPFWPTHHPYNRLALRDGHLGYTMKDCQAIEFLNSPLGGVAVVVGAVLACAGLLVWARRPGDAGRSAVVLSASALGVCVAGLNLVLGASGVWQACSYRLPLIVLAAMYLLLPIVFTALLLMGYRWLVRHTRYPALLYGAVLLVVVAPLIVIGDSLAIESGYLAFGAGYTVWMDAVVGVALLSLPVLLYEAQRRRQGRERPIA
jgi:hypothetical protein